MGTTRLWGKERAIELLMRAQRRAGLQPRLATLAPSPLVDRMRTDGFPAVVLEHTRQRFPFGAVRRLVAVLRDRPDIVLHTHGYKANVIGRLARLAGARPARLIATVHGMNDETWRIAQYNRLDRLTAPLSDWVAVADAQLVRSFPHRARVRYIENGVDDLPSATAAQRAAARRALGFPPDTVIVGVLGRVSAAKGVGDALDALAMLDRTHVAFAFAGEGDLVPRVSAASGALYTGYADAPDAYLSAIDVYLQASHWEGLSLALLEALRAGLPCVATRVGSTERAIDNDVEGFLVPPHDPASIASAVRRLADDPALRARLGAAARARFVRQFSIDRQAALYSAMYREPPA